MLCIQWWQRECFSEIVDGKKRDWVYSPSGISKIDCWVLMGYTESEKCSMGKWHIVRDWDPTREQFRELMGKAVEPFEPPEMSKGLNREFYKRTKKIKVADPWPGRGGLTMTSEGDIFKR